jgi:hypothetical protein
MDDLEREIEIFTKIKDFSESEKEQIIEIHKTRLANQASLEHKKLIYSSGLKFALAILGTGLASAAFILAAHAINSKASLIELAALITPIAGLAGVFLWGFQRKD